MKNYQLKAIALIKRKPGTSHVDFRKHYEEVHVPLARQTFTSFAGYVRNYIETLESFDEEGEPIEKPNFDVISMFWYCTFEEMIENVERFETDEGDAIRRDELSFMDKPSNRNFLVEEETQDSAPWAYGFEVGGFEAGGFEAGGFRAADFNAEGVGDEQIAKVIILVNNTADGKNHKNYRESLFPRIEQLIPQLKHSVHNQVALEGSEEKPEYGVLTELWLQGVNGTTIQQGMLQLIELCRESQVHLCVAQVKDYQTDCR